MPRISGHCCLWGSLAHTLDHTLVMVCAWAGSLNLCRGWQQLRVANYDYGRGRELDAPLVICGVYRTGERWLLGELAAMKAGVCPC